ncbi:MAG TPA: hypothetical protein PK264_16630, partial [Hyphomicrobiaceae bacterium]|nr:hypothetical protein [Hyphomicrobiaceae bacterium]
LRLLALLTATTIVTGDVHAQSAATKSDACITDIKAALAKMRDGGPQTHVEEMDTSGQTVRRTSKYMMPKAMSVEGTQTMGEGATPIVLKTHIVIIGDDVWRQSEGVWKKIDGENAARVVTGVRAAHAKMDEITADEATCDGTETVDGKTLKVYKFTTLVTTMFGAGTTVTAVFVGADGRPARIDSVTSLPNILTKRRNVITYDPAIKIEPPKM